MQRAELCKAIVADGSVIKKVETAGSKDPPY